MEKQNAIVLQYLREHPSLTPPVAYNDLGIYRLGARIFDLREKGHKILNTEPMGKPARYVLIAEAA